MSGNHSDVEKRLWDAADELRANSKLKSSEYSVPVLGLIFLRYADQKFSEMEKTLAAAGTGRRKIGKTDYQAKGVLYLPEPARFSTLLRLTEGDNIGKAINDAMKAIEEDNEDLKGVLPRTYTSLENATLVELLKLLASIPMDIEGDAFGRIYEYFLGKFAMSEGQKGGEFFTPTAIVKLIVEVIEPFHGRIYDPACGSGGMFVQSARFVENHKKNPSAEIMVYGQEKTAETVRLCKMNLAVHGLSGDIREANSYYEDLHHAPGRFDFVMANPPFNVDRVNKERIKDDKGRFPFGMPSVDNGNYLWIQLFYSALADNGRAGFVMANSAADARGSELEIRKQLVQSHAVDVVIAVGSNFFYTVTLPCTLWFFDKGKQALPPSPAGSVDSLACAPFETPPEEGGSYQRTGTGQSPVPPVGPGSVRSSIGSMARHTDTAPGRASDTVLFLDARHIYRQIDRAHRDFTPEQIEFLANIVRLYRSEQPEITNGSNALLAEKFPELRYADVAGLCKVATLEDIETQGWSLNPGRYVGVADRAPDEFDFAERLEELNEELERLNVDARELEEQIAGNVRGILE